MVVPPDTNHGSLTTAPTTSHPKAAAQHLSSWLALKTGRKPSAVITPIPAMQPEDDGSSSDEAERDVDALLFGAQVRTSLDFLGQQGHSYCTETARLALVRLALLGCCSVVL